MKNPLSYDTRVDWGVKTLPPKYTKLYGLVVLALTFAYSWKFHEHHAPVSIQAGVAVLALALIVMLALRWNKHDKMPQTLFWIMLIQTAVQAIALFRYF
jgi:hypothetical protein